jgi:hypothetical protein
LPLVELVLPPLPPNTVAEPRMNARANEETSICAEPASWPALRFSLPPLPPFTYRLPVMVITPLPDALTVVLE